MASKILDKTVIQANPLIEARKKMNVTEMRLFILGLQDVKPHIKDENFHDVEFHETRITHSELVELFGSENNGNIANLKKQVTKAYQGYIELSYENGGFGLRHIYKKMDYTPQEGLVIQFDDEIKPYVLELVNQAYTKYKVKALFTLSSEYAWRILESLLEKQGYFKQGYKEVYLDLKLEELCFRLNVDIKSYKGRIDNFRSRVLDLPIKEINQKTDYFVWYEVQKTGRKVTGFKFWIRLRHNMTIDIEGEEVDEKKAVNNPQQSVETSRKNSPEKNTDGDMTLKSELKKAMLEEDMSEVAINTWLKRYGKQSTAKSWNLAVAHANKKKLSGVSRQKYLKTCMERNIAESNETEAKLLAEAKDRERRLAAEKQKNMVGEAESFNNIMRMAEQKKKDLKPIFESHAVEDNVDDNQGAEKPKLRELNATMIEFIIKSWKEKGESFSDTCAILLKPYGHTLETFLEKYG